MSNSQEIEPVSGHGNAEDLYVEMSKHLNCPHCGGSGHVDGVATPEQEPVAEFRGTLNHAGRTLYLIEPKADLTRGVQFYTTPPQPKELEQEPVGEVMLYTGDGLPCAPFKQVKWTNGVMPGEGVKLYTTSPQRKPLTDEEIKEIFLRELGDLAVRMPLNWRKVVNAIEAARGIGGKT